MRSDFRAWMLSGAVGYTALGFYFDLGSPWKVLSRQVTRSNLSYKEDTFYKRTCGSSELMLASEAALAAPA